MKRKPVFLSLLLCGALLASLASGCSSSDPSSSSGTSSGGASASQSAGSTSSSGGGASSEGAKVNTPGTLPIVTEPISLKIGLGQNTAVEDWETNKQTLYMEEQTGIDLSFTVYPSGEMTTKLELIVAAGGSDLPDVLIGGLSQAVLMPWAKAGMITPLTEYYDSLAYWCKESLNNSDYGSLDAIRKYITSYDGQIYGMFSLNETRNNQYSGSRLNIYWPWMDKLGMEMPKSTDDLYNVLKALKNNDPNGNGTADEIAMSGYSDSLGNVRKFLMTPFVYTQDEYWTADNGTIDAGFRQDGWRDGLRYARKLYSEGLIDPAVFTQDQAALTVTLSQDPMVVGSYIRISTSNMSAQDPNRYLYYRIEQLTGPDGQTRTSVQPSIPSITGMVTKNCANPEAAFMLLDYMTGPDLSIITRYGFEGEDWVYNDKDALTQQLSDFWKSYEVNYPELYYGAGAKDEAGERNFNAGTWGTLQNTWWGQTGPNIMTENVQNLFTMKTIGTELEQMSYVNEYRARYVLEEAMTHRDDSLIVAGLIYNDEEQQVITDYYTEIKTYVEETWASFVTGALNIEDDGAWNNYLSTLEKMGLSKCIEATQSCYTRMSAL